MKKFLSTLAAVLCAAALAVGFTACGQTDDNAELSVYVPDGAPALAVAQLMYEDKTMQNVKTEYNVVAAETIQTYVTGQTPKADLAVLPVNAASKLLGSGETYQMLGVVTHGNLFVLSAKTTEELTADTLGSLKGKTVGVVNLANVPGLTFKLILKDNGIAYNDEEVREDEVYLKAIDGTAVGALTDVDYYVAPEPAASTKANAMPTLNIVGSLQTLYGGDNGYPQAVLVAKTTVISRYPAYVNDFMDAVRDNATWLQSSAATGQLLYDTIAAHLPGSEPSMNANQLNNKTILSNCAVNFVKAADCKEEVNAFLAKLIGVNPNMASAVSDSFYYVAQ